MQKVSDIMTRGVKVVSPADSLQHAAQLMSELDVGAIPVCDGERLVGMITDRDIAVRGTAAGKKPEQAHVDEVMSRDVRWCFEDQAVDELVQQMGYAKIRRLPVIAHDDSRKLLGIVSIGDVATASEDGDVDEGIGAAFEKISSPSLHGSPGPQIGTDSGQARVHSGGADGTGRRGLAGIATAGGTGSTGTGETRHAGGGGGQHAPAADGRVQGQDQAKGDEFGTAGDYSR